MSAYQYTVSRFPHSRIYVLGHSLGNGVMLGQIPNFPAPPSGVIVADAYSSLRERDIVRKHLLHRVLICLMPDWWNNVEAVKRIHIPLLVVHSDADHVNPIGGGLEVYKAANQPKTLLFSTDLLTMIFTRVRLIIGGIRSCHSCAGKNKPKYKRLSPAVRNEKSHERKLTVSGVACADLVAQVARAAFVETYPQDTIAYS